MKKRICLLITLIISLFIFSGRVEADNKKVMWLKCDTSSDKDDDDTEWIFFKTDNGWKAHKLSESDLDKIYDVFGCWFNKKDYIGKLSGDGEKDRCERKDWGVLSIDEKLSNGICPKYVQTKKKYLRIAEQGTTLDYASLDKNEYLVYSLNDISYNPENRKKFFVLEFYDSGSNYHILRIDSGEGTAQVYGTSISTATVHPDVVQESPASLYSTREISEFRYGKKFFQIGHGFDYSHLANFTFSFTNPTLAENFSCNSYETCKNLINIDDNKDYGVYENFEVLFDSGDNFYKLEQLMDDWISDNKTLLEKENLLVSDSTNEKLINTCKSFNEKSENGEMYFFSSDYSANKLLDDLSVFAKNIDSADSVMNSYKKCSDGGNADRLNSASNCIMYNAFGGLLPKNLFNYKNNAANAEGQFNTFYALFRNDIEKMLNNKLSSLGTSNSYKIDEQIDILGKCAVYLDKYSSDYDVDKNKTSELRKFFEDISSSYNVNLVVDCEGLLGSDLFEKIGKYFDIFKIAVPLILIAFGVIDFSKAFFGGSEDEMNKAQKTFFKRIGIAILIYFVPIFVRLILTIANEVWSFFSPDTCGLF